jgi:hypothetical protein
LRTLPDFWGLSSDNSDKSNITTYMYNVQLYTLCFYFYYLLQYISINELHKIMFTNYTNYWAWHMFASYVSDSRFPFNNDESFKTRDNGLCTPVQMLANTFQPVIENFASLFFACSYLHARSHSSDLLANSFV